MKGGRFDPMDSKEHSKYLFLVEKPHVENGIPLDCDNSEYKKILSTKQEHHQNKAFQPLYHIISQSLWWLEPNRATLNDG